MSRSNRKNRSSRKGAGRKTSNANSPENEHGFSAPAASSSSKTSLACAPDNSSGLGDSAPLTAEQAGTATGNVLSHLEAVLKRFDDLDGRLDELAEPLAALGQEPSGSPSDHANQDSQLLDLQAELEAAWRENEELRHQNEHLTAELASSNAQKTVKASIGVDESLSWDDRKAMIMAQMEDDSFDAEEFVSSLSDSAKQSAGPSQIHQADSATLDGEQDAVAIEAIDPLQFVESLVEQLGRLQEKLQDRDEEIKELQHLLQNQADTRAGGVAIGAAAIAGLVDSDELIIEERERLQQLKNDWEDKFRQSEIDASLERAKLSRERQELAKRTQQLEEQIEDLQREKRGRSDSQSSGRRWLAELGLATGQNAEKT